MRLMLAACLLGLAQSGWALAVTDSTGRTVEVKTPVQKMVILNSAAMEMARILGAEDRVLGVSTHIAKELLAMGLPAKEAVGSWQEPNVEAIVKLAPDVVIVYAGSALHIQDKLKPFGIAVLRLDLYKLNTMPQEIDALARLLHKQEQARAFLAWHTGILQGLQKRMAALPQKTPAYLESYFDYHVAGIDGGLHQLCRHAGCQDIASDFSAGVKRVLPEWIVRENPAAIFKMYSRSDEYQLPSPAPYNQMRDAIMARPAWRSMQAVQSGRVHVMESSLFSTPRSAVGAAYMAKWLHPQQLADIDPDALHAQYMQRFLRLPARGVYFSTSPAAAAP
ncbi:MAG: ABC transporter substrate-binding protein [Brachymonas sp.]|nr:ABC transporter substrate-binding protein [Brachymonas sp.]